MAYKQLVADFLYSPDLSIEEKIRTAIFRRVKELEKYRDDPATYKAKFYQLFDIDEISDGKNKLFMMISRINQTSKEEYMNLLKIKHISKLRHIDRVSKTDIDMVDELANFIKIVLSSNIEPGLLYVYKARNLADNIVKKLKENQTRQTKERMDRLQQNVQ